ncbi:MAG: tRNA (adenosine(37)-N6)-dimethylallyltransferase MiaA [Bdellovibrionaceae bacterium]|nr:tRNA (adenosine(37)-N6)-dimethylallyltransferase MiaA [Pseudobdellovibrionaceae bacterium]
MKVVFWVGATGTGKTARALDNAELHHADILNADSVQMYEGVDIGSAKPTAEERARAPHFLFDLVKYPEVLTAGDYNRHFFELLNQHRPQRRPQFVVGGTGFYFQAIEKGILEIPKANPETAKRLEAEIAEPGGEAKLHQRLQALDPVAGARIHARDHYRVVRALDIIEATGQSLTSLLEAHKNSGPRFPDPLLKLGLRMEREEHLQILRERTRRMLQDGWLDEVQGLIGKGQGEWEPLGAVGYRECVQFLRGEFPREELEDRIVQSTSRLAKKQRTWFQKDPEIRWFHPSQKSEIADAVAAFLG